MPFEVMEVPVASRIFATFVPVYCVIIIGLFFVLKGKMARRSSGEKEEFTYGL